MSSKGAVIHLAPFHLCSTKPKSSRMNSTPNLAGEFSPENKSLNDSHSLQKNQFSACQPPSCSYIERKDEQKNWPTRACRIIG
jgi:hypothetical protein